MESKLETVRYIARFRDLYPAGIPIEPEPAAAQTRGIALAFVVNPGDLQAAGEAAGLALLADAGTKGLKLKADDFEVIAAADSSELMSRLAPGPRAIVLLGSGAPQPEARADLRLVRTISLTEILASRESKKIFWNDLRQLLPILFGEANEQE